MYSSKENQDSVPVKLSAQHCLPHQTELHEGRDGVQEDALVSSVRHCHALVAYSNRHTSGVDKQVLLKRKLPVI